MDSSPHPTLAPPPRSIPLALSVRVVLGGVLTQIGWGVMCFGMIFVAVFGPGDAISGAVTFSRELATANGATTGWNQTSLTINDRPVYEVSYRFRAPDGQERTGVSFATGRYLDAGVPVTIEYLPSDPSLSRIRDMRSTPGGLMVSFVLIFPVVGLLLALFGLRRGLGARRLMSTGRMALGTLKAKEPTNTRVNEQTVYRYTFEFEADGGGTYEAIGETHRYHQLEDEPQERIVYDPRNPSDATVLDELPCRPHVDRTTGNFTVSGPDQVLWAGLNLVLPALALLMVLLV